VISPMYSFIWTCVAIVSVIVLLLSVISVFLTTGALQDAAAGALVVCCVVLPYSFARAIDELKLGAP
jgi:hypothetical protein